MGDRNCANAQVSVLLRRVPASRAFAQSLCLAPCPSDATYVFYGPKTVHVSNMLLCTNDHSHTSDVYIRQVAFTVVRPERKEAENAFPKSEPRGFPAPGTAACRPGACRACDGF